MGDVEAGPPSSREDGSSVVAAGTSAPSERMDRVRGSPFRVETTTGRSTRHIVIPSGYKLLENS